MQQTLVKKMTEHYTTLVLGAGISGLACASKLYEHASYRKGGGGNTLRVLEARDRIGGRIESVHVNGSRLDTGANWIHGVGTKDAPNPLMGLLPDKRVRSLDGVVAFSEQVQGGKAEGMVVPKAVTAPLMDALWGTIDSLHTAAAALDPDVARETSMLSAIQDSPVYREAFSQIPEEYHSTLQVLPQFIENIEAGPLIADSAVHQTDAETMGLHEFAIDDFDGENVFVQDGFIAVVDHVARNLVSANLVQLDTEVTQIVWDARPLRVSTTRGDFTADNVVCTLPLGVLKHHQEKSFKSPPSSPPLFQPRLPQPRTETIAALGFGVLDKVFLVYDEPWWEAEPYSSLLAPGLVCSPATTDDPSSTTNTTTIPHPQTFDTLMGPCPHHQGLSISPNASPPIPSPRILTFLNLHHLTDFPVLSTFLSCANATKSESISPQTVATNLHTTLTTWLGGREPPRPTAVHVTGWAGDRWSRGSYSYMKRGQGGAESRGKVAGKVRSEGDGEGKGGLRFAGEHTSRECFATVHGALLSGWREAEGILGEERGQG